MNFKQKPKAFTLIEVLVSVGIFLLTIMAISQIFITIIRSERVAYALLNSENNIRNNLELMAKTIRMGKNFNPDDQELCFDYYYEDSGWNCLCYNLYYFDLQTNTYNIGISSYEDPLQNNCDLAKASYSSLLDRQIEVVSGHFYQIGDGSNSQLSFIIQLEAQIQARGIKYPFHVETAVTSRYIGQ